LVITGEVNPSYIIVWKILQESGDSRQKNKI